MEGCVTYYTGVKGSIASKMENHIENLLEHEIETWDGKGHVRLSKPKIKPSCLTHASWTL